jgi:hypothetical protein
VGAEVQGNEFLPPRRHAERVDVRTLASAADQGVARPEQILEGL